MPVAASQTRVLALVLALTPACVFTPPPPLPGEESDLEPSRAPGGSGGSVLRDGEVGEARGRSGDLATRYERGAEPDVGMTLEELQAFNAAQGDHIHHVVSRLHTAIDKTPPLQGQRLTPRSHGRSSPCA
jgi:hypothetical protein